MTIDTKSYEKTEDTNNYRKTKNMNCYEISRGTFWFTTSNNRIYIYIKYDFWLTFNSTLFGLKGNKMEVLKGVCCNLC